MNYCIVLRGGCPPEELGRCRGYLRPTPSTPIRQHPANPPMLRNADDFAKEPEEMANRTARNHRCHPRLPSKTIPPFTAQGSHGTLAGPLV